MEMLQQAEVRQGSPCLRGQLTGAWLTVVRNVRAQRRSKYVKSKGRVNARRGRKTSVVAGEAKLRETDDRADDAIIFSTLLAFAAILLPFFFVRGDDVVLQVLTIKQHLVMCLWIEERWTYVAVRLVLIAMYDAVVGFVTRVQWIDRVSSLLEY
jgi:hypothetical protein